MGGRLNCGLSIKERVAPLIKYVVAKIVMNFLKVLWIFPLNPEKILFLSFDGKQYSDSPKYISEYILINDKRKKIVWAFNCPNDYKDLVTRRYKITPRYSPHFLYVLTTAKTIITNNYLSTYIPIRKKQILLNTWHGGSPLKTVGFADVNSSLYDKYFYKLQNPKYSAFISSSRFVTEEVLKNSFGYQGEILEYGMPRNAILLSRHEVAAKKVYDYLGIVKRSNIAIVLYAPTFRGDAKHATFLPPSDQFDVDKCILTLENKFEKTFVFLFRAHHTLKFSLSEGSYISVSDYPDMQELLCAADVLITDYSSCMGDMALMAKPTFLYTPDVKEYIKERGFYWDISTLPFPLATTEQELTRIIEDFNDKVYKIKIRQYLLKLGCFEASNSIQKTYDWLVKEWNKR